MVRVSAIRASKRGPCGNALVSGPVVSPGGPYVWVHPDEERYAAIGSTMGAVERRCSSTAMVSLRLSRRAANVPASKGYVTFERSNTPACSSSVAMSQLRHWTTRSRSEISVLICAASRSALSLPIRSCFISVLHDPFWHVGRDLGALSQGHRKNHANRTPPSQDAPVGAARNPQIGFQMASRLHAHCDDFVLFHVGRFPFRF